MRNRVFGEIKIVEKSFPLDYGYDAMNEVVKEMRRKKSHPISSLSPLEDCIIMVIMRKLMGGLKEQLQIHDSTTTRHYL